MNRERLAKWNDLETSAKWLTETIGEKWSVRHVLEAIDDLQSNSLMAFAVAPHGIWESVCSVSTINGQEVRMPTILAGDGRFELERTHAHDLASGRTALISKFRVGEDEYLPTNSFAISTKEVLIRKCDLEKLAARLAKTPAALSDTGDVTKGGGSGSDAVKGGVGAKGEENPEIPGKLPRIAIGRLAVTAAWQIECKSKRAATAEKVIEQLKSWATGGEYPDILLRAEPRKRAVIWVTKKTGREKDYDVDACEKTLYTWRKTRA